MSDEQIRLLLADDQELVRMGFRMVLDAQPDMQVVGEVGDGAAAIELAAQADVVLMDIRMPRMDGVEATRRIVASGIAAKVLVLTTFDLDEYVHTALKAGAGGFLLKDAGPAELLAAIRAVHQGDSVVAPSATRRLLERFLPGLPDEHEPLRSAEERLAPLTEREREVLLAVGQGRSNQEIAAELYVAEATVKTHVGRILAKLHLRDRVQMVVLAYDTGLVRPQS
ncbi:response regulator transcription factor [uncultured Arsenicicoccus sp.]|uniref:response regulator n=1 Tax=uncultured Arsenicicoccus sp. TaxID=491339 RepID=UPI0025969F4E|nr:response regulator transcription factor [uncultured Arsenicicoccus sp.]